MLFVVSVSHPEPLAHFSFPPNPERLAELVGERGGDRPEELVWAQRFDLSLERASTAASAATATNSTSGSASTLTPLQRARIMYYLRRKHRLHPPMIYRLFWQRALEARSIRTSCATRDFIAYDSAHQRMFDKAFFFLHVSSPMVAPPAAVGATPLSGMPPPPPDSQASGSSTGAIPSVPGFKKTITAINKLRPRFVVLSGSFTTTSVDDADTQTHVAALESFHKMASRISEMIPVLFVPGPNEVGSSPTTETLNRYRSRFGADYFGFWHGGLRVLVLNSALLGCPDGAPSEAARQRQWLDGEIEQSKLAACQVMIWSHHAWFLPSECPDEAALGPLLPLQTRLPLLRALQHHKVRFLFGTRDGCGGAQSFKAHEPGVRADAGLASSLGLVVESDLRGGLEEVERRRVRRERRAKQEAMRARRERALDTEYPMHETTGEPLKPSEVIALAKARGEINDGDDGEEEDDSDSNTESDSGSTSTGSEDSDSNSDSDSDSDSEDADAKDTDQTEATGTVKAAAKEMKAKKEPEDAEAVERRVRRRKKKDKFENIEEDYEGPEMVLVPRGGENAEASARQAAEFVHVVRVFNEEESSVEFVPATNLPKVISLSR
jgi:hypothetical protein